MISREAHNTAEDTNFSSNLSLSQECVASTFSSDFSQGILFLVEKVGLAERLMEWGEALRDFDVCFTESYCQPAKNLKPKIK